MERNHLNYGGLYRETETNTGVAVTNFACPTQFNLREEGESLTFNFRWERWEDTSDFDSNKTPIAPYAVNLNSQGFPDLTEITASFEPLLTAIRAGVLEFLELSSENFDFVSINIDAMNFNIFAEAKHKTRENYRVTVSVNPNGFESVKLQYLNSITLPLLVMTRTLAVTDRNLAKFKAI